MGTAGGCLISTGVIVFLLPAIVSIGIIAGLLLAPFIVPIIALAVGLDLQHLTISRRGFRVGGSLARHFDWHELTEVHRDDRYLRLTVRTGSSARTLTLRFDEQVGRVPLVELMEELFTFMLHSSNRTAVDAAARASASMAHRAGRTGDLKPARCTKLVPSPGVWRIWLATWALWWTPLAVSAFSADSAPGSLAGVVVIVVIGWLSPIGYLLIPLGTGLRWWAPTRGEAWPIRVFDQALLLTPTRAGIVIQNETPARPASRNQVSEALVRSGAEHVGAPSRFEAMPTSKARANLPALTFPCHGGMLRRSAWLILLIGFVVCIAWALLSPREGSFPLGLILSLQLLWVTALVALADVGSFSVSPSGVYPHGLAGRRIDWIDLMTVDRQDNSVLIMARGMAEPIRTQFRGSVDGIEAFHVAELVERLLREQRVYHRGEAQRQRRR